MSSSHLDEPTGPLPLPRDRGPAARPNGLGGADEAVTLAPSSPSASASEATLVPEPKAGPDAEQVVLPGYAILAELGRGGMGVVYKARQLGLNRLVAIKMILAGRHAGEQELARFRTEAEAVARLQHPNIVQVHDVGEQDGCPYFSLEYVEGGSLADRLDGTPQPPRQAAELVATLAEAIHAAHQRGIIHRDLKPANILLQTTEDTENTEKRKRREGDRGGAAAGVCPSSSVFSVSSVVSAVPKITDFGLAKRLDQEKGQTQTGSIMGTPSYMAPEQAEGKKAVGPAADVYALGAILYELLTGRPPFRAETPLDTVLQVVSVEPVPPTRLQPKVPRDLETICLQCLQKDPRRRYASALFLADDLRHFLADEPIRARPVGMVERAVKWARRQPVVAGLLATVVAVTVVGLALVLWQWQTARREKQEADAARDAAQDERRKAVRLSAVVAAQHGLILCESGDAARGMIWLAHALRIAPPDDPELGRLLRLALSAWEQQFGEQKHVFADQPNLSVVAFSPDGKFVFTGSSGPTSRLWDAATGQPHGPPLLHGGAVKAAAFSPDGRLLLTGADDKTARLWNTADATPAGPPLAHEKAVAAVAFSPDGKLAVTGSQDQRARVWDTATSQLRFTLPHAGPVLAIAFGKSSDRVLMASQDGTARLWDATTGQPAGPPLIHKARLTAAALSPDAKLVATAGEDFAARLWDAATGQPLPVPPLVHRQIIHHLSFSPDGQTVLTVSRDTYACRWDAATGKRIGEPLTHNYPALVGRFSPDGRTIVTGGMDNRARLWDAESGKLLLEPLHHPGMILSLAFSPDGRLLLAGSSDGSARLWDLSTAKRGRLDLGGKSAGLGPFAAALSPDGRRMIVSDHGRARLWDMDAGRSVLPPLQPGGAAWWVLWDREGVRVVTGGSDAAARLYDAKDGRLLKALPHPVAVYGVELSPDGRILATGSHDGRVRLWDLETGQARELNQRHVAPVFALAFSPDGKTLLSGSLDVALVWDLPAGTVRQRLTPHGGVTAAAFSRDGQSFVTGGWGGAVHLWDAAALRPVGEVYQHQAIVRAVAFSPDGRLVLSGSLDKTARLLDRTTGRPVGPPLHHNGAVMAAGFGPDGKTVYTAGPEDNVVQFWAVPTPLEEDPATITARVQALTGLAMDDDGTVRVQAPPLHLRVPERTPGPRQPP